MSDGPFTDDMAREFLTVAKMQQEIIPHMEEMAQKLAAAGVASNLVRGHSAEYAIDRWCEVIRKRARELVAEKRREVENSQPVIEHQKKLT